MYICVYNCDSHVTLFDSLQIRKHNWLQKSSCWTLHREIWRVKGPLYPLIYTPSAFNWRWLPSHIWVIWCDLYPWIWFQCNNPVLNHVVFLSQFDPSVNLSSVFFILLNIQLYSTLPSFYIKRVITTNQFNVYSCKS